MVLVEYTAKIKEGTRNDDGSYGDAIFETTSKEVAHANNIFDDTILYGSKLVSIGDVIYPILTDVNEKLAEMSIGDKQTVEIEPAKAFGERRPDKVRMIPFRKLGKDAEKYSVGDSIEIDGKTGVLRFIGSGRVQIDYNHIYAGKTVIYEISLIKSLDTADEKIHHIIRTKLSLNKAKFKFKIADGVLTIPMSLDAGTAVSLESVKRHIQTDIFRYVPDLGKIIFFEIFTNPKTVSADSKPTGDGEISTPSDVDDDFDFDESDFDDDDEDDEDDDLDDDEDDDLDDDEDDDLDDDEDDEDDDLDDDEDDELDDDEDDDLDDEDEDEDEDEDDEDEDFEDEDEDDADEGEDKDDEDDEDDDEDDDLDDLIDDDDEDFDDDDDDEDEDFDDDDDDEDDKKEDTKKPSKK